MVTAISLLFLLVFFSNVFTAGSPTSVVFLKVSNTALHERTQELSIPLLDCAQKCFNVQACVAFQFEKATCIISFIAIYNSSSTSDVYKIHRNRDSCDAITEDGVPDDPLNTLFVEKKFECIPNRVAMAKVSLTATRLSLIDNPEPNCGQYCLLRSDCSGVEIYSNSLTSTQECWVVRPEPGIAPQSKGDVYLKMETCTSVDSAISTFSASQKATVEQLHNEMRAKIARGEYNIRMSSAAAMMQMKWNYTLESSAQKQAARCVYRPSNNPSVGENFYDYGGVVLKSGEYATGNWSVELAKSRMFPVTYASSMTAVENATQMIWAETHQIGCGATMCFPGHTLVVCHYWPKGNIVGSPIYLPGATCSNCTSGTTCIEEGTLKGLCQHNLK